MEAKHREILFVRETNAHIAVWEGAKLTKSRQQNSQELKPFTGLVTLSGSFRISYAM